MLVGREGIELTSVHQGNLCDSIMYNNVNISTVAMCEAGFKHAHVGEALDMGQRCVNLALDCQGDELLTSCALQVPSHMHACLLQPARPNLRIPRCTRYVLRIKLACASLLVHVLCRPVVYLP